MCRNLEKGNLVNWDTAQFEMLNLDVYEADMDSVCHPVRKTNTVFTMYLRIYLYRTV